MVNVKEEVVIIIGNVYFNKVCLFDNFGVKIFFVIGRINIVKIEVIIVMILEDILENDFMCKDDVIYVDEYEKYVNCVFDLVNFS